MGRLWGTRTDGGITGTIIRPTGKNLPKLFSKERLDMEWIWLRTKILDKFGYESSPQAPSSRIPSLIGNIQPIPLEIPPKRQQAAPEAREPLPRAPRERLP
jgi:hypothetical protein